MFKQFSLRELILITLLATVSIASKQYVYWFSSILTASFHVPAGVVGGLYYMMWLVLIYRIINKHFSVLLFCIVQAFLALTINGIFPLKALTFIFPGIIAELIFLFFKNSPKELLVNILVGASANAAGAVSSYLLFFGKQTTPLIFVMIISILSGGASGILTDFIYHKLLCTIPSLNINKSSSN